jgi:hypothetical protein
MTPKIYETLNSIYNEGLNLSKIEALEKELRSTIKDNKKIKSILDKVIESASKKHKRPNKKTDSGNLKSFLESLNLGQGSFFVPLNAIAELYNKSNPDLQVSHKTLGKWLSSLGFTKRVLIKNSEAEIHYLMNRPLDVDLLLGEQ